MASYSPAAIRQAIREVLDGTLQGPIAVEEGAFAGDVFAGQSVTAQLAKLRQTFTARNRFDVRLLRKTTHPASPAGGHSNSEIAQVEVQIDIQTPTKTLVELEARDDVLQQIASDCNAAITTLRRPEILALTSAGVETGIVSGMLLGPGGDGLPQWELMTEDWDNLRIYSRVSGVVWVHIQPANEIPSNILLDDDLVTPINDDDGQFILVTT